MFGNFFRKYGWLYLPGVVFLILQNKLSSLIPEALGDAIDLLESGAVTRDGVLRAAFLLVLLAIGVFFTQFGWRYCVIGNARRIECAMRESFFVKLQSLPVSYFARQRSGDLIAYAINDINAVRMMFGPLLAMAVRGIAISVFSIASMAGNIDARMTMFVLLPLPFAVLAIVLLGSLIRTRFTKVQGLFARISGFVNESIMGVKIIKSFAREDEWEEDYDRLSGDMRDANLSLVRVTSLLGPSITVAFGISYAVSLIYGGNLVLSGSMTVGQLVAYQGYLALVKTPVVQLGRIINLIVRGTASYRRLHDIFAVPSVSEGELAGDDIEFRDRISVRSLTFRYEETQNPALDDISFELPKGTTLGITGPTGCGKTTLISLLLKLYDVPRGTVFVDGKDLCDLPAYSMRGLCGYVPQDSFLFSDSIRGNIAFYTEGATEERIREAAHVADIDPSDRDTFPEGYETEVGERGTHLSGGQKQRISLARALAREPQLLLLDDTLSAVDSVTEKHIKERLSAYFAGRTVIVISQKLSALTDCDNILYMENGRIAEQGSHEALIAQGGAYAALWRKQCADADADAKGGMLLA